MLTRLLLVVVVIIKLVNAQNGNCSKLQAAFSYNGTDYFVYGANRIAGFNAFGHLTLQGDVAQTVGFNQTVTAAASFPGLNLFFMESGTDEQAFHAFHLATDYRPLAWSHADSFFKLLNPNYHGIDAAVRRGVFEIAYFSDCLFVVVGLRDQAYISTHGRVESLGLPCGIDSAFVNRHGDYSFLVKGNRVWPWAMYTPRPQQEVSLYEVYPGLRQLDLCQQ